MSNSTLAQSICRQDRAALAKAMSVVESGRADHKVEAARIIEELNVHYGRSFRLGVSGPPGVGKSTFVAALVSELLGRKLKIAVLAVDPSSPTHGGSVLGDLTRMGDLFTCEDVFFRAMPSRGESAVSPQLGDFLALCDGFGFDFSVIETVGIGQADFSIRSFCDYLITLEQPASGDDVQAMKSGLIEVADCLLVSKADGDSKNAAEQSLLDLRGRLRNVSHLWVEAYSVFDKKKLGEIFDHILRECNHLMGSQDFLVTRKTRSQEMLEFFLQREAWSFLSTLPEFASQFAEIQRKMGDGNLVPSLSGRLLFSSIRSAMKGKNS